MIDRATRLTVFRRLRNERLIILFAFSKGLRGCEDDDEEETIDRSGRPTVAEEGNSKNAVVSRKFTRYEMGRDLITLLLDRRRFASSWCGHGAALIPFSTGIGREPMVVERRYWRWNSRRSRTMQLRSLETPDEHRQLAERGAEFAGRRLLLQQNSPYRSELLVAGKALVVPGTTK